MAIEKQSSKLIMFEFILFDLEKPLCSTEIILSITLVNLLVIALETSLQTTDINDIGRQLLIEEVLSFFGISLIIT